MNRLSSRLPPDARVPAETRERNARVRMSVFTVGQASIARIEETYLPVYRPGDIFPEWNDKIAAEHAGWLAPNHYDAAQGLIKLSVHSWLLQVGNKKFLIDACCGNHKRRPTRPFWNMLDTPYLVRLAPRAARRRDTAFRGDIH